MTVHSSDIKQLGVYEIRGRLGAGGMGEVYRARDLRLGRDVAEFQPVVAPDVHAVAYVSTEAGRAEVYIAAWPALDRRHAVSTQGGVSPWWSPDSRELFFWRNQTLMVATVDRTVDTSDPRPLFSGAYAGAARDQSFDVAKDGRFLMVKSDERSELKQITVVQNWMTTSAGAAD